MILFKYNSLNYRTMEKNPLIEEWLRFMQQAKMVKVENLYGDVIESGAVKHVTYNNHYYGEVPQVPEVLCTPQAEALLAKLSHAGIVDNRWQPLGLTGEQRGLLASEVAERLGIRSQWMLFGKLWKEKPETLRSYYNKGMGSSSGTDFLDRMKEALKD